MKLVVVALMTVLTVPLLSQQKRGKCSEARQVLVHGESFESMKVRKPFRGWVGETNTGTPIESMLIEIYGTDGHHLLASTSTDSSGNFAFPQLPYGTYLLLAKKRNQSTLEERIEVTRQSTAIACLVGEALSE